MRRIYLLLLLLALCLPAGATTMQLLTLDQLTQASQIVIVGDVLSVSSGWQKNRTDIATSVKVHVQEYVKSGTERPSVITLQHPGGKAVDSSQRTWSMIVPGVPTFVPGVKAMLFCRQRGQFWELTGWSQGYFRVQQTASGQETVAREIGDVDFVNDVQDRVPEDMTLNHLVSLVRRMAQ